MTNKEKIIGKSSLDFAEFVFHSIGLFCNNCNAYDVCEIKDTDKGQYKPNCVHEIARWLDMEAIEK